MVSEIWSQLHPLPSPSLSRGSLLPGRSSLGHRPTSDYRVPCAECEHCGLGAGTRPATASWNYDFWKFAKRMICMYMYVCLCVYIYVCVYIYIYVCVYIYICMCIYIYKPVLQILRGCNGIFGDLTEHNSQNWGNQPFYGGVYNEDILWDTMGYMTTNMICGGLKMRCSANCPCWGVFCFCFYLTKGLYQGLHH